MRGPLTRSYLPIRSSHRVAREAPTSKRGSFAKTGFPSANWQLEHLIRMSSLRPILISYILFTGCKPDKMLDSPE